MPWDIATPANLFNRLSEEIVEAIVKCIDLEVNHDVNQNIQRFALCDRRLRRIALPIFYCDINLKTTERISRLFLHLIDFPHYAPLIKVISLTCDERHYWKPGKLPKTEISRIVEEMKKLPFHADIITEVERNLCWPIALGFLPLLVHLEEFHIRFSSWDSNSFSDYFSRIHEIFSISPSLRSVNLETFMIRTPFRMEVIFPLLLTPSITCISVRTMESDAKYTIYGGLLPQGSGIVDTCQSSVETLRLYDSDLSEDDIYVLLRSPKTLKEFIYLGCFDWVASLSPRRFQQAIDRFSDTLNTLVMDLSSWLVVPNQVCSFAHFKALRTLSIQPEILFDHDPRDIVDRLPPSLENLILNVMKNEISYEGTIRSFRLILTGNLTKVLPRLNRIGVPVACAWMNLDSLDDLASAKNIIIDKTFNFR
ncbi:hypothetical protein CPB86DRAFT_876957 [Serendipita vermifera]|nr:hypothetical protein CPB86DRAFT_876957 [Serendipita vermifera]